MPQNSTSMSDLNKEHTKTATREIIDDFARDIKAKCRKGAKPSKCIIYFRNWQQNKHEEEVLEVPTELLRFRKDNGRIASDVLSYEKNHSTLEENSPQSQDILRKFLENKDPEKTKELVNAIKHSEQKDPAIITADGFLINGNRRKMALEKLYAETNKETYKWMKVVILPGKDDKDRGGPPTVHEIEQIENRYQLQSEGKSEYAKFDMALSMRRKINLGISLRELLRDDPNFVNLSEKEFKKKEDKYKEEFLDPLECVDRYLEMFEREGLYSSISSGMSDKEGRWQAFLDYSKFKNKLGRSSFRNSIRVSEDEIGEIEEIAFKIIRKRDFEGLDKVHKIMRELPKILSNEKAKESLRHLLDIEQQLSDKDRYDSNGKEYSERDIDKLWSKKHQTEFMKHVKTAYKIYKQDKEEETPLSLLEQALKKLGHKNMNPQLVKEEDIREAMKKLRDVQRAANNLEKEFYRLDKNKKRKNSSK